MTRRAPDRSTAPLLADVVDSLQFLEYLFGQKRVTLCAGIVFIDEIDKLKSTEGEQRSTSGERVQHALLKIMEGAAVRLGGTQALGSPQTMDTTNILFICAGAFVGIESITTANHAYGFIFVDESDSQKILDRLNSRVKPTDLFEFGLIPEFAGRLPIIANLRPFATYPPRTLSSSLRAVNMNHRQPG